MDVLTHVFAAVPTWLWLIVATTILIFWYLKHTFTYWKRAGIPYVLFLPFTSNARKVSVMPLHEIELLMYKANGRFYGFYEGTRPILIVGEPDVIRDILVKDFQFFTGRRKLKVNDPFLKHTMATLHGKDWKRVRSVVSPSFSTGKIKKMTSFFVDSAKTLVKNLKTAAKEGESVDAESLFGAFTMDVIGSCAFATKIDSHNDPGNPFVETAKKLFRKTAVWRLMINIFFPRLASFFGVTFFHPDAVSFFENATLQIVEERKRSKQRRNDFLQLLMDAVEKGIENEENPDGKNDDGDLIVHENENDQTFQSYLGSKYLSHAELVSQCISFFIGGYSTVASTLTFAAYELALHPDAQDKVIAEIDEAIEEKGELNYDSIAEMKFLDNVIAETLRKYPALIRTERVAEEDYHIKALNVTVPKGMIVGVPIYAIHHDAQYYPDPEKFDPDRFSTERKSSRHPYTYLPFGAGPRNCVATRFALMEMKVCLAYVLSQCRFSTCDETDVPLQFVRNLLLAMEPKKVALSVEIRSSGEN